MMPITPTKEQLVNQIISIDKRQRGEAFPPGIIGKIVGTPKPWRTLKKDELFPVLDAWKELEDQCPKTANWQTVALGDRIVSVMADGQRWVDYFGFPSLTAAEAFLERILPHCQWAMLRKSGKRVNASYECKVWGLKSDHLNAILAQNN